MSAAPLLYQAQSLLLGTAVGDALGVPVEGRPRGSFRVLEMSGYGANNQPAGSWSDDTSLTLALVNAARHGDVDMDALSANLQDWLMNGRFTPLGTPFGMGKTTVLSILRLQQGIAPEKAGGSGERDNGNGSLMRVAPLGMLLRDVEDAAARYDVIRRVSSITHSHPWSVCGCCLQVELVRRLSLGMGKEEALNDLRARFVGEMPFFDARTIAKYARVLEGDIAALPVSEIRSTAFVVDTLEAAFWSFATTSSYAGCVLTAVHLGDDTDTVGAVAGALAGLAYGVAGIPDTWSGKLLNREMIAAAAQELAAKSSPAVNG